MENIFKKTVVEALDHQMEKKKTDSTALDQLLDKATEIGMRTNRPLWQVLRDFQQQQRSKEGKQDKK